MSENESMFHCTATRGQKLTVMLASFHAIFSEYYYTPTIKSRRKRKRRLLSLLLMALCLCCVMRADAG